MLSRRPPQGSQEKKNKLTIVIPPVHGNLTILRQLVTSQHDPETGEVLLQFITHPQTGKEHIEPTEAGKRYDLTLIIRGNYTHGRTTQPAMIEQKHNTRVDNSFRIATMLFDTRLAAEHIPDFSCTMLAAEHEISLARLSVDLSPSNMVRYLRNFLKMLTGRPLVGEATDTCISDLSGLFKTGTELRTWLYQRSGLELNQLEQHFGPFARVEKADTNFLLTLMQTSNVVSSTPLSVFIENVSGVNVTTKSQHITRLFSTDINEMPPEIFNSLQHGSACDNLTSLKEHYNSQLLLACQQNLSTIEKLLRSTLRKDSAQKKTLLGLWAYFVLGNNADALLQANHLATDATPLVAISSDTKAELREQVTTGAKTLASNLLGSQFFYQQDGVLHATGLPTDRNQDTKSGVDSWATYCNRTNNKLVRLGEDVLAQLSSQELNLQGSEQDRIDNLVNAILQPNSPLYPRAVPGLDRTKETLQFGLNITLLITEEGGSATSIRQALSEKGETNSLTIIDMLPFNVTQGGEVSVSTIMLKQEGETIVPSTTMFPIGGVERIVTTHHAISTDNGSPARNRNLVASAPLDWTGLEIQLSPDHLGSNLITDESIIDEGLFTVLGCLKQSNSPLLQNKNFASLLTLLNSYKTAKSLSEAGQISNLRFAFCVAAYNPNDERFSGQFHIEMRSTSLANANASCLLVVPLTVQREHFFRLVKTGPLSGVIPTAALQNDELDRARETIQTLQTREQELTAKVTTQTEAMMVLRNRLTEREEQLGTQEAEIGQYTVLNAALQTQVKQRDQEITALKEQLAALRSNLTNANTDWDDAVDGEEQLAEMTRKLNQAIGQIREEQEQDTRDVERDLARLREQERLRTEHSGSRDEESSARDNSDDQDTPAPPDASTPKPTSKREKKRRGLFGRTEQRKSTPDPRGTGGNGGPSSSANNPSPPKSSSHI